MKIKAVIVDDEVLAIKSLSIMIEEHFKNVEIVGTAGSVNQGIELVEEHKPDLLFLDIEMPSGSGFEVVEKTAYLKYKLIFTTAYNDYAIKAFKVNAIDYLLKPIDEIELIKAVQKAIDQRSENTSRMDFSKLFSGMEQMRISIPTKEGYDLIDCNDLIRVESDSNYTWFHFQNKNKVLVSKTLKEVEKQLERFNFIRVHNSHLVNRKYIIRYIKSDGGHLILSDNAMIPVSKQKRQVLLEIFT
ncbi:MAG: response regulator transcription factor [Crocinitomicaceae bacterium]|jgi:two-component system LytT family response regulator|nr:response regulator transcription factor [Crocinitomicaceae bacterium]